MQVSSRARGQVEDTRVDFNESGQATVYSASGRDYTVDYINGDCTCLHHRMRGGNCRHINAARQALGQIDHPQQLQQPIDIRTSLQDQANFDAAEERRRNGITAEIQDDGYFYSDNEDEFNRTLERAAREPLRYEYENVLNGSRNTFGIELEFVGGNADAIAQELYQLGICSHDHRVGYHSRSVPGKWRLERDGSVSIGAGGGELVSPVLQDTPETWRTIEKICEVAKRHGATINDRCGGHVHISMDPLDTARQRWKRFFKSVSSFEDVIYRLAGGSLGRIRSGSRYYAREFAPSASSFARRTFNLETENDVRDLARRASNNNRYFGINLTNISDTNRPNTVEFRYFNGSLDPAQIQANIKIANGVIVAAEKARLRENQSQAMRRRGQMLKDEPYQSRNREDHSMIKKFVDIFFTRKSDKDSIIGVYSKNTWRD